MKHRSPIVVWIQATRPRTLVISLAPVLIGTLVAYTQRKTGDFTLFLFTLFTACAIQVGTNLANDYFDFKRGADTAARKGPQRVTQAGLVSPRAIQIAYITAFALAAASGLYLIWVGGALFAWLLAAAIALGILYTAGPFSLAYLGIADIFVFSFFGPAATATTCMLQTHAFSWDAFFAGVGPGGLAWAIFLLNNLRDVDEDRLAGKKTLCVRGGKGLGRTLYTASLALALLTPWIWVQRRSWVLLSFLTVFWAAPLVQRVWNTHEASHFNPLFKQTTTLLLLYTTLFCLGWIL